MFDKSFSLFALILVLGLVLTGGARAELVGWWAFDEGSGTDILDSSGFGNHGTIHARHVARAAPADMPWHLTPVDDFVDCGKGARLDVRGPVTITAWICPAGHQPAREPGVLGKQFSSYLLTYYWDRRCYWYVNSGANHADAAT